MQVTHLNSLRALEATLRHGSFSVAARELGVKPAAVGQRVKALEDYIGRQLCTRTPTGIHAHDDIRDVAALLTRSFTGLAAALAEVKSGDAETRLSVTLPVSFVENWLASRIAGFHQRHTSVDLRLDASNRDVDLMSETFDFAVRYGAPPEPHLEADVLFEDHVLAVCSPDFAADHLSDHRRRSLKDVPLIDIDNRTSDQSWVGFEQWGRTFGFDGAHLGHGIHFSKVSSGLQSAIAGQSLVLCGLVESSSALGSGQLVMPFGPDLRCKTKGVYRLLHVRGRKMGGLQSDFRAWLLGEAAAFRRDIEILLSNRAQSRS